MGQFCLVLAQLPALLGHTHTRVDPLGRHAGPAWRPPVRAFAALLTAVSVSRAPCVTLFVWVVFSDKIAPAQTDLRASGHGRILGDHFLRSVYNRTLALSPRQCSRLLILTKNRAIRRHRRRRGCFVKPCLIDHQSRCWVVGDALQWFVGAYRGASRPHHTRSLT
jgi:hypothetical protein